MLSVVLTINATGLPADSLSTSNCNFALAFGIGRLRALLHGIATVPPHYTPLGVRSALKLLPVPCGFAWYSAPVPCAAGETLHAENHVRPQSGWCCSCSDYPLPNCRMDML